MARLVKTQVEMEGRYEERWTLFEDDTAPEYAEDEELAVVGPGDLPDRDGRPVLTDAPAYAGAAVAAVAADTPDQAERALEALAPEWEPLAFVVDLDEGLSRQDFTQDPAESSRGDVDAALANAAAVVEREYRTPAQMQNPLEPHCAGAVWESGT